MTGWMVLQRILRFCPFRAQPEPNDFTQGDASLCPGLCAGCPCRACFNLRDSYKPVI